jgi:hypothetical protein
MLEAKIDLAPEVFRAESSEQYGQPAYAKLAQDLMNSSLYGEEGEGLTLVELGKKLAADTADQNRISQTAQRENELADVENLGGRYMDAIDEANPELTALRSKIGTAGSEALDRTYDTEMTAEDIRNATQGARTGYADRGMFRSNPSVAAEVLQTDKYRRYLEDRAKGHEQMDRNFALGAGQFTAATSTDPLQAVLGRPGHNIASNAQALGQAGYNAGQGQPNYYDPFDSAWGTQMSHLSGNQQGQYASNAAGAQIGNDIISGFMDFF